jgi:hypothetical protein
MSMRRRALLLAVMAAAPLWLTGCESARFVQVQQSGGVVAIPSNTNAWPTHYRDHALELIAQKCPNGYVIVDEKEEVVGQRVSTDTRSDTKAAPTFMLGGASGDSSTNGKSGKSFSEGLGGIAVPLGDTRQTTYQTTHAQDVTEWRIYYKAK